MSVVEQQLSNFDLSNQKLLLACSGGLDSIVLFHTLVQQKIHFAVIHVNYQLRGIESDEDQAFVEHTCAKYGIPLRVFKCPTELTKNEGKNLQNEARKFRHTLFQQWTAISENHKVLLAHHKNDQVETFFLQYFRGSGTFGLAGMAFEEHQLIRPFLAISKDELKNYATERQLKWREDESNSSSAYLRNLFRNQLLPKLETAIPSLNESVILLQKSLQDTIQLEKIASEQWVSEAITKAFIPTEDWEEQSEVAKLFLLKTLDLPTWFLKRLNEGFQLGLSAELFCEDYCFYKGTKGFFVRKRNTSQKQWEYKIEKSATTRNETKSIFVNELLRSNAVIDKSQLELRCVRKDDKLQLPGMNGQKRVWDLLKEAGIPSQIRSEHPILLLDNQVLWIPNMDVSNLTFTKSHGSSTIMISLIEKIK